MDFERENTLNISEFNKIAVAHGREESVERISLIESRLQRGIFRLIVVGEIKKGKSSFINALLGIENMLPTASDVATSTVYKIVYGPKRKLTVFFKNIINEDGSPAQERPPMQIEPEQIEEFGTETGNPDNKKDVEFIAVEVPHSLLKSGLVIVDTPGLGGLFHHHADITWNYIPKADAVFFILDSVEAVASTDEMEFLKKLRSITPLVTFIQTKIDAAQREVWQGWEIRNKEIIAKATGMYDNDIVYFPVSANMKFTADRKKSSKHLQRSGYVDVLDYVKKDLIAGKQRRLKTRLVKAVMGEIGTLLDELNRKNAVLAANTDEQLNKLEAETKDTRSEFEQWERDVYRPEYNGFRDQMARLRQDTLSDLQNQLDPSPNGPIVAPIIRHFREKDFNPKELNENASEVQSKTVEYCSRIIHQIQDNYNKQSQNLLFNTMQAMGHEDSLVKYDKEMSSHGFMGDTPFVDNLQMNFNKFESVRQVAYAGMFPAMAANIAAAIIFPPAIVPMMIIGGVTGLILGRKGLVEKKKDEAVRKLQSVLQETVSRVQRFAFQQFQETSLVYETQSRDAFSNAVDDYRASIDQTIKDISVRRSEIKTSSFRDRSELENDVTSLTRIQQQCAASLENKNAKESL
ncbi:MAG: dynamin family protein [Victivallales bacterium]|nr:dynamin family protein [Victivallales bacterium]